MDSTFLSCFTRNINLPICVDDERNIEDVTQAPIVQGADRGTG